MRQVCKLLYGKLSCRRSVPLLHRSHEEAKRGALPPSPRSPIRRHADTAPLVVAISLRCDLLCINLRLRRYANESHPPQNSAGPATWQGFCSRVMKGAILNNHNSHQDIKEA
jgi:hypothetical protein